MPLGPLRKAFFACLQYNVIYFTPSLNIVAPTTCHLPTPWIIVTIVATSYPQYLLTFTPKTPSHLATVHTVIYKGYRQLLYTAKYLLGITFVVTRKVHFSLENFH